MKTWHDFLASSIGDEAAIEALRGWMKQLLGDGPAPDKILVLCSTQLSGKSVLISLLTYLVLHQGGECLHGLPRILKNAPADVRLLSLLPLDSIPAKDVAALISILDGQPFQVHRRYKSPRTQCVVPSCALVTSSYLYPFTYEDEPHPLAKRCLFVAMRKPAVINPELLPELMELAPNIIAWAGAT